MTRTVTPKRTVTARAVAPTVSVRRAQAALDVEGADPETLVDAYAALQEQIDKVAELVEMQKAIRAALEDHFATSNSKEKVVGHAAEASYRKGACKPVVRDANALWDAMPEDVRRVVFVPDVKKLRVTLSEDDYRAHVDETNRNKDSVAIKNYGAK